MINTYINVDQKQRELQGVEAVGSEAAINSDRYYQGYAEGSFGMPPTQPEFHSYWEGYQIGAREYWASKLKVEIPTEF